MRHRWWVIALCMAAVFGSALPSQAGIKGLLKKRGEKKKQDREQILTCVQQRAWIAYFKNDEGEVAPLRDTLSTENDEDWIGLRFTDYEGPRIRLGVLKVINKSAEAEENEGYGRIEVEVAGIQELLTAALYETKRFDVIEQKRVEEILGQQKRTDVVEPSPSSIQNVGKVVGAQYLVYGTVNEWSPERASRNMGPGGVFNAGKKESEIAITFTLADVGSGQILYTTSERARHGEWSFGFGAPGGGGSTTSNTPTTYLIRACVNKAAFKIATFLRDQKWKGSIVDIKKADFYINAGSQQGMAPQTRLSVQSVRGIVKDPQSGTVLGEDLKGIGTLEVVSVQTGFSIARVVDGCQGIKKGDRVELASDPVLPPKIPACEALYTSTAP